MMILLKIFIIFIAILSTWLWIANRISQFTLLKLCKQYEDKQSMAINLLLIIIGSLFWCLFFVLF